MISFSLGRLFLAASCLAGVPTAAETEQRCPQTLKPPTASRAMWVQSGEADRRALTDLQVMLMVHQFDGNRLMPGAVISPADPACFDPYEGSN